MPNSILIATYRVGFRGLDLLRLDTDDARLSAGVVLGFALGLTPLFTLHALCLWMLLLVVRVNPLAVLLSAACFAALSAPFDGLFHSLGLAVLTPPGMHRLWAGFYHWPVVPHTHFYNTVVMGRWIVTLVAALPLYAATRGVLTRHRGAIEGAILGSAFWRTLATSRLYRLYASYHKD